VDVSNKPMVALFLDEIGDMPSDLQTRLLRVLCDGQFYRVGGHQPVKVNVRIIAATHQDLEERVKLGLFREDLFHRLNVIRLRLPPLRERREDIPLLVKHFLQQSAQELGVEPKIPSAVTLRYLANMGWSGNVRQLENVCHWLTVMAPGQNIDVADLPPELKEDSTKPLTSSSWQEALALDAMDALNRGEQDILDTRVKEFERILITKALQHTSGRRIEAANQLGMGRNTLTRKIQELGIDE
jgi:two-component system, NtrC family, nitrogen regulation response regulator GlnG